MNRTMRGRLERTMTSSIYMMTDDQLLRAYALLRPCENCHVRNCKSIGDQYTDAMDCYNSIYDYVKEDNDDRS